MSYVKFEVIRPLYAMRKRISLKNLKVGDRFIYEGRESLMFKTDAIPNHNNYLCCDESGNLEWISGNIEVLKINGTAATLVKCSKILKANYLNKSTIEM